MRVLVDLVDSFTGMVRFIIVSLMVVGFGIALVLTAGVSYVAPKVAEEAGDRATMLGERAIEEARQAERDRNLAKDGWGYGSPDGSQGSSSSDDGGWGDEAR